RPETGASHQAHLETSRNEHARFLQISGDEALLLTVHEAVGKARAEVVHDRGSIVAVDLFKAEPRETPDHCTGVTGDQATGSRIDGEARIGVAEVTFGGGRRLSIYNSLKTTHGVLSFQIMFLPAEADASVEGRSGSR